MELQAIEIALPVAAAASSGWLSARGWRQLAGVLSAMVALWCLAGAFKVGFLEAMSLLACSLFLAYPCGRIAGRLRELW